MTIGVQYQLSSEGRSNEKNRISWIRFFIDTMNDTCKICTDIELMENRLFMVTAREDHSDRTVTIITVEYLVSAPNKKKAEALVKKHSHWRPQIKGTRVVKTKRPRVIAQLNRD
jgi:hypothetical protein